MKKKINIMALCTVILIILYILFRNFSFEEYNRQIQLTILRSINLIIFITAGVMSYKYFKKNYIIFLFLIALFIFQYGRVNFIWIFNRYLEEIDWFVYYQLNFEMKLLICDILFFNIVGSILGIFFCIFIQKNAPSRIKSTNFFYKKINISKILIVFLIFSLPLFLYGEYVILKGIQNNSYATLYKEGLEKFNDKAMIVKVFSNIFICSLYLFFSLKIKYKKLNKIIILLYLFMTLLITLRGARTPFVSGIFFLIWYYHYLYEKKIKLLKISIIFVILVIFSQIFGGIRENVENNPQINILKKIEKFMYQQGVIGTFLSTPLTHPELYIKDKIPYLFTPITGTEVKSQEEKFYIVEKSKNIQISHKMSYLLNKKMYLNGNGVGGNYILEMYDLGGKIGVFIFSYLFIIVLYYYSKYVFDESKSLFFRMLLISKMPMIFLVPRGNFIFFKISLKDICVYGIFYFIVMKLSVRKNTKNAVSILEK